MAWGAGEEIVSLLRNTTLLQRLGVRFLAVRSEEERSVLEQAMLPAVDVIIWQEIAGSAEMEPVGWENGLLWPVRVDEPGLYRLELDARPVPGSASRWFVGLETPDREKKVAATHAVEPVDLSIGGRRMRFVFFCPASVGPALVRVKSEIGQALWAGHARFGLVARAQKEPATQPAFRHVRRIGDVDLHEVEGSQPLVWMPDHVQQVSSMRDALEWLLGPDGVSGGAHAAVVQDDAPGPGSRPIPPVRAPAALLPPPVRAPAARVSFRALRPELVEIDIDTPDRRLIVLNTSYSGGWHAELDGQPADIVRVNAVAQGVWSPAGQHRLRFRYTQPGLGLGGLLSIAGWLVLTLVLVNLWRRCGRTIGDRVRSPSGRTGVQNGAAP
jgi:hypothetical protein